MDGQNFENENNVTVDTTATEQNPHRRHLQQNSLQTIIRTILLMYSLR